MSDPAFADQLFRDAEKALSDYDLTAEEMATLKSMSHTDFEKFSAATPEEQKSFGIMINGWPWKTTGTSL